MLVPFLGDSIAWSLSPNVLIGNYHSEIPLLIGVCCGRCQSNISIGTQWSWEIGSQKHSNYCLSLNINGYWSSPTQYWVIKKSKQKVWMQCARPSISMQNTLIIQLDGRHWWGNSETDTQKTYHWVQVNNGLSWSILNDWVEKTRLCFSNLNEKVVYDLPSIYISPFYCKVLWPCVSLICTLTKQLININY